jgi:AAA15 family ATPase/GTPase
MAKASQKTKKTKAPSYTYLERAILNNKGPIKKSDVVFKPGLNIIIGRNGAGKTSFFETTFKLLKGALHPFSYTPFGINVDAQFFISNGIELNYKKVVYNKADLIEGIRPTKSGVSVTYKGVTFDDLDAFTQKHKKEMRLTTVFVRHGVPIDSMPIAGNPLDFTLDKELQSDELSKIGFSTAANVDYPYFISSLCRSIDLSLMFSSDTTDPKKRVKNDDELILNTIQAACKPFLSELNQHLPKYSPIKKVRISDSINIHRDSTKGTISVSNFYFEYFVHNDWMIYSNLSDGTKRVFYIIAEVLAEYISLFLALANREHIQSIEKILIIEEPELGIHPHQYHDLLDFINEQSQYQQIIITTHAPQTLDILERNELDRLLICSYDKELGTIFHRLTDAEKEKALMYMDEVHLSEYWRVSDLEKDAD